MNGDLKREALRLAMPWLVTAGLLIVWEVACVAFDVPEILPEKIVRTLVDETTQMVVGYLRRSA